MFCNFRWATLALVAVLSLTAGTEAQVKPFKITGGGAGENGLPGPGEPAEEHWAVGTATHLGKYDGIGSVQTDSLDFSTFTGEFGGGSPFVFTGANGDKLVTWYGRTEYGARVPGTFELTIVDFDGGIPIVTAHWVAEFVVQPEDSTGKFAGVTGSWIMDAYSEPFRLGTDDPVVYTWHGEGELTFPKKN